MNLSLRARIAAVTLACVAAACSSSSSDGNINSSAATVTQDLARDADGLVTSVPLGRELNFLGAGAFEADGGQTAQTVTLEGETAVVTWDERVTPAHRVRVVGVQEVDGSWRSVESTDTRQPALAITSATQDVSDNLLGGDELVITFTDGPRVVEAIAEDPDTWDLQVASTSLDLSDSTFDLVGSSQVLTITLGPSASLHASFSLTPTGLKSVADVSLSGATIVGSATGDTSPPTFEGAAPIVQNLDPGSDGDEFGRVVEIDFNEPISPVFGVTPSNFDVQEHVNSTTTTLVTGAVIDSVDHTKVRVTFSRPVVPGLDEIRVNNVRDAHGNLFATATAPITASGAVANGFTAVEGITREGQGNDRVVVTLDQAIDPDTAEDPTRWTLTLGAPFGAIDLSTQALSYDLLTKTFTVDLNFDFPNGTTVDVSTVGHVDIDGDTFSAAAPQALASGDTSAPVVVTSGITQRRDLAGDGRVVDVEFSEGLDATTAQNTAAYTFSPAITVSSAILQVDGQTVRLQLADAAIPGDHTLTVAASVSDPAGNAMTAPHGPAAVESTDTTAPAMQLATAQAVEGADNDTVFVFFDDNLIESEVVDEDNWTLESPVGTPIDVTTSGVSYDSGSRMATLVLDGAAVKRDDDFSVSFANVRDLGGNTIGAAPMVGAVTGETNRPAVELVWRRDAPNDNQLVVRFSEASDRLTGLYDASTNPAGAKYTVYDSGASMRGRPTSAAVVDGGLGVELTFPFTIALTDTLDLQNLEDLAGNVMFPTLSAVVSAEDPSAPDQSAAPTMVAVTGERNDIMQVTFTVPMATWGLTDPSNYVLQASGGGPVIDLSSSTIRYDGNTTLNVILSSRAAASLQAGTTYDLSLVVNAADPLRTRQGVPLTATDSELNVAVGGDITSGPTQGASSALLDPANSNALFIVFDEAVDETAAETAGAYDYSGGNLALSAELVSPRVVNVVFGVAVGAGNTVDVTTTAAVDLAGNAAAATLTLTVVDDTAAPILTSVIGTIEESTVYDIVTVGFNEPLELTGALDAGNYSLTDSRGALTVYAADWDSAALEVTLYVSNLLDGDTIALTVDGVTDAAGNGPVAPLTLNGAVGGDTVAPQILGAFVNLSVDPAGRTVDVEFDEALVMGIVDQPSNWSTTGAATVLAVDMLAADHARVLVSAPLSPADQLVLAAGVSDLSGNTTTGDLTVDPVD